MNFQESEEHRLIRGSVRKLCAEFPDQYWEQLDREGLFPCILRKNGCRGLDWHRDAGTAWGRWSRDSGSGNSP